MRSLDVYLADAVRPVGVLESLYSGSTRFQYAPDYVEKARAVPLSLSLPVRLQAFGDATTRAFFENLLPENDQIRWLMEVHGIDRSDFVSLLEFLGADCPGALSCVPRGSGPVKNPGVLATDYDALDTRDVADFVRRMANGHSLPDEIRDPSLVAGYQQKMALTRLPGGAFALPRPGAGAPTTHILKVPQVADRRDAELERAAALLAQGVGLSVVVPEVVEFGGHPAILSQRYDRHVANGVVSRLHQEDFAQAMGLPASLKYERRGFPGRSFNAAAVHALLQQTAVPALAVREFLKLTLFNACVGNADNHAKNHSLLYQGGPAPRLAPAYDLLPTRLNPNLRADMGFRIGTAVTAEAIVALDIALLLRTFGLSDQAALRLSAVDFADLMVSLDFASGERAVVPKDLDNLIGANLETLSAACGLEFTLRERDHYQSAGGGWLAGS